MPAGIAMGVHGAMPKPVKSEERLRLASSGASCGEGREKWAGSCVSLEGAHGVLARAAIR